MPVAGNIVLADAQATPVNHTFKPIGRDKNGVFWYEDQSQSNSIGFWRISVKTTRPNFGSGVSNGTYRTEIGLHEPVLETLGNNSAGLTPPPTVAYVSRAIAQYIDPTRSGLPQRSDMVKMLPLLLQDSSQIAPVLLSHEEISY